MLRGFPLTCLLSLTTLMLAGLSAQESEKPGFQLSKQEQAVIDLTNKEREKEGLSPLKANPVLCELARAHSKNMAVQKMLSHKLDGKDLSDRANDAGYKFTALGENIAMGTNLQPINAVEIWMKSEAHKANMLNSDFQQIGVGLSKSSDGDVYFTQVFGKER